MQFITPFFVWLALLILFLVIELLTVSLVSIWFVGGALAALLAALVGMPVAGQIILFFVVSVVLLSATRPFVLKYVKPHNVQTNYEQVIGKTVQVTERIDNLAQTGRALYNGQEWSARSVGEAAIEAGQTAVVKEIKGVKLYVERTEADR